MIRRVRSGSGSSEGRRDRGAADALALVVLAPAVMGLAILAIMLGRNVDSRAQMRSAAEAAAQAAALERDPAAAEAAAVRVARAMLVDRNACEGLAIAVDFPAAPASGVGTSFGLVQVDLTCTVSNRGVEAVDLRSADERTDVVSAVAAVDFFRARQP